MSKTSDLGYWLRTGSMAAVNDPVDAVRAGALCNNAMHACDASAQTRVKFAHAGWTIPGASVRRPIYEARFPVSLRQNGDPYKLRVRVGARSSDGTTGRIWVVFGDERPIDTFGGVYSPATAVSDAYVEGFGDACFKTVTFTSTSAAWLTGSSMGVGSYATYCTVPGSAAVYQSVATRQLASSSPAVTVDVPTLLMRIYPPTASPLKSLLCGLVVEEVV